MSSLSWRQLLRFPKFWSLQKPLGSYGASFPHIGPTQQEAKVPISTAMASLIELIYGEASKALGVMTRMMESLNKLEIDIGVTFTQAIEEEVK
ncbi:hypothetical protein V6N13_124164 [Hibiscus sabdariffa]